MEEHITKAAVANSTPCSTVSKNNNDKSAARTEYSFLDVIVDPASSKAKDLVGKKVYFSNYPNLTLAKLNAGNATVPYGVLKELLPSNPQPFLGLDSVVFKGSDSTWTSIIIPKKAPKNLRIRYTIRDVVIDAKDARVEDFAEAYVGDTPSEVLKHANNNDRAFLGRFERLEEYGGHTRFVIDTDNQEYECIIFKKPEC